jgi:hypothetical protein
MIKRFVLSLLCIWPVALAHAADVQMGSVTLKLGAPTGYCELDPSQASDKRMIDFLNTALANSPNELLGISADCNELRDWRAGSLKLLGHFSQYQVEKVRRAVAFTLDQAKAACATMRTQGAQLSADTTRSANVHIHEANKKIDFHGQDFLGVLADDPNGCYVALFQKYKAETGQEISQLNVFFMGSIKDREVFFYLWGPHENDASITGLLGRAQSHMAALKAANGL